MATTIAQKLRIREGMRLYPVHAPEQFRETIGPVPGLIISKTGKNADQIHWFVKTQEQLKAEIDEIIGYLKGPMICWIYYPKGSSGLQTDLTRDSGWEAVQSRQDLQWLSLISFDPTWSAFAVRLKNDEDLRKAGLKQGNPAAAYVDRDARTVRLPDDLAEAMAKAPEATVFFDTLSFTNKREYVEWVVSAKREETRATRVKETVERLERGWKNPANRE